MAEYTKKPFLDYESDPVSPTATKLLCPTGTVSERLEMIREERNMSRAAFAKSIALSPQGYRAMIMADRATGPVALAVEYKHGFCKDWVQKGEGPMKTDTWEMIRGEVEDSILRDLNVFLQQKLKRTRPMIIDKDNNAKTR